MSDPIKESDDHTPVVLASFCSWDTLVGAESYFDCFVDFINKFGITPSYFWTSERDGKFKQFKTLKGMQKSLKKDTEPYTGIGFSCTKNTYEHVRSGWDQASFSIEVWEYDIGPRYVGLWFEHGERYNIPKIFDELLSALNNIAMPSYGYATNLLQSDRVGFFGAGVGQGDRGIKLRPEFEERVTSWGPDLRAKHHKSSKIRDLFQHNYLNQSHLNCMIKFKGETLKLADLIHSQDIGTLSPLEFGVWLWSLSCDEIAEFRGVLLKSQFLVVPI